MSKSAIYTSNTTTQNLVANDTINLGTIVRRFGQNVQLSGNGNAITVIGSGYYKVDAEFVVTATTAGTISIYLLKDNVAISGAVASVSVAVGDVVTIGINALVREFGCCCDNNSNLTFVLSGAAETVTNTSVVVERI